ncbi:unnamed protein product [Penicillium roqueforti FM164]|uniref:Genomic scaffold, ProqFM164S03 n=1 Tax=Penicillium roqueforti (strain FM164) TaxID=1365484 RepID=W6QXI7_PENRF|nr:unnamed protein product [Penicillium roqueforti FM164]
MLRRVVGGLGGGPQIYSKSFISCDIFTVLRTGLVGYVDSSHNDYEDGKSTEAYKRHLT